MVLKKFCIMPPKNKDKKFYGHGQKDPAQKSRISCLETNVITQSKRETLVRSKNNSTNRSTITSSEKKTLVISLMLLLNKKLLHVSVVFLPMTTIHSLLLRLHNQLLSHHRQLRQHCYQKDHLIMN